MVQREKIQLYLLNESHPDNGGKAAFFSGLGFQNERWKELADALLKLAQVGEVANYVESPHGTKYILDGRIVGSNGQAATVRTIWIRESGLDSPRLVTAYSKEREE